MALAGSRVRGRTLTVALVGGDGAGKTTIAKSLKCYPLPSRYVYMGPSTLSSNAPLPTTRLVRFLKLRAYSRTVEKSGNSQPLTPSSHDLHYASARPGLIWATARFANRLAEAWWRQLLSLRYRLQGYIVVYDRHYLFESAPGLPKSKRQDQKLMDRLEFWMMSHLYPKPDLVIFLDAPPQVLYDRKAEATLEYLEERRGATLEQGKKMPHFVRVDAAQPLEEVLADVAQHIQDFYASRNSNKTRDGYSRLQPPEERRDRRRN